jgi:hypothetical protein
MVAHSMDEEGVMSVEVWMNDDGDIECQYGKVAQTWVSNLDPGVISGMGPTIICHADPAKDTKNLGTYGIEFTVRMDAETGIMTASTKAKNGHWVHVLEHAHWRGLISPSLYWADEILIGRWHD